MDEHARLPLHRSHWAPDTSVPVLELTVGDALRTAAARFGGNTALVDGHPDSGSGRGWTFAELLDDAPCVARGPLQLFRPGEHVAVWGNNSPEWLLLEFGAALAGLVLVTVNPAYRARELAYVLKQSQAVGLFAVERYRDRDMLAIAAEARNEIAGLREILPLATWTRMAMLTSQTGELPIVTPDDIAQIQYTSGTTGFPKGALLRHRGLTNNARFFARAIGAQQRDTWVNPMPLFHTAGCGLATLGGLQTCGRQVLPPAFDAGQLLVLVEAERGPCVLVMTEM